MYKFYASLIYEIHEKMSVLHFHLIELEFLRTEFIGKLLFLDKSLGENTGISPTRFLIRQYPDPISESLAFWATLIEDDKDVSWVARQAWNPKIKRRKTTWIRELAENPAGLNIEGRSNIENVFKQEVKSGLIIRSNKISNESSLELTREYEEEVLSFLESVTHCFPRVIAGFLESSIVGISVGVIRLIQNSRIMRNIFKSYFSKKDLNLIVNSEKTADFLRSKKKFNTALTRCGATRSDELRNDLWGVKIVG